MSYCKYLVVLYGFKFDSQTFLTESTESLLYNFYKDENNNIDFENNPTLSIYKDQISNSFEYIGITLFHNEVNDELFNHFCINNPDLTELKNKLYILLSQNSI